MYLTRFLYHYCLSCLLLLSLPLATYANSHSVCQFSHSDQLWLQQGQLAWQQLNTEFVLPNKSNRVAAIFFDGSCQGKHQMNTPGASDQGLHHWHRGQVLLPSGQYIPPAAMAFMSLEPNTGQQSFFVMALPSVWLRAGYQNVMGLDKFLTGVMLHEMSHLHYSFNLALQLTQLMQDHAELKGLNDDSIQYIFRDNLAFKRSVEAEVALLLKVSKEPDDNRARNLLIDAMALHKKRENKWFDGQYSSLKYTDPIWLTVEGTGQWLAYHWLIDDKGANIGPALAQHEFALKAQAWSQQLGFALFIAAERFSDKQTLITSLYKGQHIVDFINLHVLDS